MQNNSNMCIKPMKLDGEMSYTFIVLVNGKQWGPSDPSKANAWKSADQAFRAWLKG